MALSTKAEIKQEILDSWEQFKDNAHPDDLLSEFADSNTPIYYGDIISQWQEMPSEFDNYWQEIGAGGNATITSLMQIDLYNYYSHLFLTAYNELCDEMPTPEED